MAKSKEELKSLLMKVKEESEKAGSFLGARKESIVHLGSGLGTQVALPRGGYDLGDYLVSEVSVVGKTQ